MTDWVEQFGLLALFAIIAVQALGVPGPPGKTALVTAALIAAKGRLEIWQVIAVAAVAGAIGGYAGYAVGRLAGRRLLERPRIKDRLGRPLQYADAFFDRHGGKSVFFARFLPGLKVVAAPAAGIARMPVVPFVLWHTAAAIAFAVGFGLMGYYAGAGLVALVEHYGIYSLAAVAGFVLILFVVLDQLRRRGRLPAFLRVLTPKLSIDD